MDVHWGGAIADFRCHRGCCGRRNYRLERLVVGSWSILGNPETGGYHVEEPALAILGVAFVVVRMFRSLPGGQIHVSLHVVVAKTRVE